MKKNQRKLTTYVYSQEPTAPTNISDTGDFSVDGWIWLFCTEGTVDVSLAFTPAVVSCVVLVRALTSAVPFMVDSWYVVEARIY